MDHIEAVSGVFAAQDHQAVVTVGAGAVVTT